MISAMNTSKRRVEPKQAGSAESERVARHPIRVVSQRTGLTPDLLRAWEKRYAVVEPDRSSKGQRLYTDEDVARLGLLRRATEAGRTIGRVASLGLAELERLVQEDERHRRGRERRRAEQAGEAATSHLEEALDAVKLLDAARLDALLVKAALRLGSDAFLEHLAVPMVVEIGEAWHAGRLSVAHEHLASASIQRVLGWLLWSTGPQREGPALVVATPSGLRHELGAMLVSAIAAAEGWRVVYLGPDLPAADIVRAAEVRAARAVALSVVYPPSDGAVAKELRRIAEGLPDGVALIVGGGAAASYERLLREVGATYVPDLTGLRMVLSSLRSSAA